MVNVGLPVAFTVASDITSAAFALVSQYQSEIVIQPRGTRIPVVNSLMEVPGRISEIKQVYACLVKEERIILVFANTIDAANAQGSDTEQMLMETVKHPLATTPELMLIFNRFGDPVLGHHELSRHRA